MIVRTLEEITGTERDVQTEHWRSKRIVLAGDGVGFSLHETVLDAGSVNDFWYANHIEAVFVVEGEGELTDKEDGVTYRLGRRPDSLLGWGSDLRNGLGASPHRLRRTLRRTRGTFFLDRLFPDRSSRDRLGSSPGGVTQGAVAPTAASVVATKAAVTAI